MMQADLIAKLPGQFLLFAARHATPDRSRSDIPYHTVPGPELTPFGRTQAAALGGFLREAGVVHILTSPLVRSVETARIAAEIAGAGVDILPDLAEWRLDELEPAVIERMQRGVLLAAGMAAERGPVAFVSHGSPVLTLLNQLGLPQEEANRARIYDSRNLIPMGGAWRIERSGGLLAMELAFVADPAKVAG